jgi:hypothetical protein
MSDTKAPRNMTIERCERGYLVTVPSPHQYSNREDKFTFEQITDLATWLIAQCPATARDPIIKGDGADETDLRKGVTKIQHGVLDLVDAPPSSWTTTPTDLIRAAISQSTEAERIFNAKDRIFLCVRAAAELILAAQYLEAREVQP